LLGVIHRKLGVLQHVLVLRRLTVGQHEADRGGEENLPRAEADRRPEAAADGVGESGDAGGLAFGKQDDAELIARDTRKRILRLQKPSKAARDGEQNRIADRHAGARIHLLEAVKVDDDDGRPHVLVGRGHLERGLEPVDE
jgi:hypothetical protein